MGGPWEDYQQKTDAPPAPAGPWTEYQSSDAPTKITVRPADARPKPGAGESFGRGLLNSASFNFLDELKGLARAGGVDPDSPDANLGHILMGAYRKITSDPEAAKRYEEEVAKQRAQTKQAQEENPVSSLAGNVAGALTAPIGAAARGATMGARALRGAIVGSGVGAVSGFGAGEGGANSVVGGAGGAALGGAVGAAGVPLVEGALRAGRAVTAPLRSAVRGAINPETEAARRVVQAVDRDVQNAPNGVPGLTPQEFVAGSRNGGPATIMDIGGETTRALARSAANTSPEGREVLNRTINDRFEGQGDRVTGWLRNTFNFPDAAAQQHALETTARTVNSQAYRRAYQEGANGLWSPELERLAGSDAVSGAMQRAAAAAKDEAIVSGQGAMNPRVTFSPDGRMQLNRGPNGVPTYPDLQYWDLVRRELSDAAQRAGRGTSEARRLTNFASTLNGELDRLVPSYRQARQGAAHFFGAGDALEAGQNFVTSRVGNPEARAMLGRMSPTERQLFQDGFVSRFVEQVNATGDRRSVLNSIANSPAAREKLQIALGRQRAAELEAGLRIEGIMDLARGAVQGNSTTARQLTELGLAGGAGSLGAYGAYNADPTQLTFAALSGALLAGRRHVDQRVAAEVARMLTSQDPAVLQRGIQRIVSSDRFMNALRATDRRLASVGGQQTSGVVPQLAGTGRADENQPSVPRPPGQ